VPGDGITTGIRYASLALLSLSAFGWAQNAGPASSDEYIALTAQLDHSVRRGEPDLNGLQLQWSFTF
jgi:hypothetical protein